MGGPPRHRPIARISPMQEPHAHLAPRAEPPLRLGSRCAAVLELRHRLVQLGFLAPPSAPRLVETAINTPADVAAAAEAAEFATLDVFDEIVDRAVRNF